MTCASRLFCRSGRGESRTTVSQTPGSISGSKSASSLMMVPGIVSQPPRSLVLELALIASSAGLYDSINRGNNPGKSLT